MVYSIPHSSGIKAAPQIVVLLDADGRVLSVSRTMAGSLDTGISDQSNASLHEQLHPGCKGSCRFSQLWQKALLSLEKRGAVEWELEDLILGKLLRLRLSIPPLEPGVEVERRGRRMLLSIMDITTFRKEHRSLARREQELSRMLLEKGFEIPDQAVDRIQYQNLSRQVIRAQEAERKRIASDLHDGIAQTLGGTKYQIELAVDELRKENPDLDLSALDDTVNKLRDAVEEIRRISTNLAPSMLQDFGLCVALDWLCRECREYSKGIEVRAASSIDECDLPDILGIAIYRVAQEALSNALRHAGASKILLSLSSNSGGVEMSVIDDGDGFGAVDSNGASSFHGGNGLRNMRERVEATGGIFSLDTSKGKGTTLFATWDRAAIDSLVDEAILDSIHGNR